MGRTRWDETWHRLRDWTKGQGPSERLAAQILIHEGFSDLDPSHPLGGRDGGKDAIAKKGGKQFAMAVYFPRGDRNFSDVRSKFEGDLAGAKKNGAEGIAFVTNQELRLSEREDITDLAAPIEVQIYHLERITAILDTPAMASIRQQYLDIEAEDSLSIDLGGKGGAAPGAGGGGGGAVGRGARGGRGGDGGSIRRDEGEYTVPWSQEDLLASEISKLTEMGLLHTPGAGGGGAGAVGDGAVAGDGGDGGETVSALVDVVELRRDGFHHCEIIVGKGGAGGSHGEDTIVNFVTEDGRVLKTLRAHGGQSGGARLPEGVFEIEATELQDNFRATALTVANAVEFRDGLLFLLGAGWSNYSCPSLPFDTTWPIAFTFQWDAKQWREAKGVFLTAIRPDGREVTRQAVTIPVQASLGGIFSGGHPLNLRLDMEGLWSVRCQSGPYLFGDLKIKVVKAADIS